MIHEIKNIILLELYKSKNKEQLCDLEIYVDDNVIYAHSSLLFSVSGLILKTCLDQVKCPNLQKALNVHLSTAGNMTCFDCTSTFIDIFYGIDINVSQLHVYHIKNIMVHFQLLSNLQVLILDFIEQELNKQIHLNEYSNPAQSNYLVSANMNDKLFIKSNKLLNPKIVSDKTLENLPTSKKICCLGCKYECYKPSDMLYHLYATKHGNNTCTLCLHRSDTLRQFTEHLKKHDNTKVFFCTICEMRFQTRALLKQHLPSHSNHSPYQCSICCKRFKWKHGLNSHLIVHTKEKKHLCDECGFSTERGKTLRAHQLTHTGEFFKCHFSGCTHTSLRKENMKIHEATHTKQKPYVCEICGLKFTQNKNLQRHSKVHINSQLMTLYACPHCPFQAVRPDNLKAHMTRLHTEKPMKLELEENFEEIAIYSDITCINQSTKLNHENNSKPRMKHDLNVLADAASTCTKVVNGNATKEIIDNSQVVKNFDNLISNPCVKSEDQPTKNDEVFVFLLPFSV